MNIQELQKERGDVKLSISLLGNPDDYKSKKILSLYKEKVDMIDFIIDLLESKPEEQEGIQVFEGDNQPFNPADVYPRDASGKIIGGAD